MWEVKNGILRLVRHRRSRGRVRQAGGQKVAEKGGVGGQYGAVGPQRVRGSDDGDVGEAHRVADGLHDIFYVEEDSGAGVEGRRQQGEAGPAHTASFQVPEHAFQYSNIFD